VVVLVSDVSRATLDALEGAGLEVVSMAEKESVVVGRIGLADVQRLVELGVVRKVELME